MKKYPKWLPQFIRIYLAKREILRWRDKAVPLMLDGFPPDSPYVREVMEIVESPKWNRSIADMLYQSELLVETFRRIASQMEDGQIKPEEVNAKYRVVRPGMCEVSAPRTRTS